MRLWRPRANDVDEGIATHISIATADRIARGTSPEEARRAALREFGNQLLVGETTRRMWAGEWLEHILQDIRYAWRQMRRSPAFTLTVIATLALGLGATLAMFTVVENVLLQVLPYRDAHHLVTIYESGRRGDQPRVPWLDIQQWRSSSRSFESIGFYRAANGRSFLEGDRGAQQVSHQLVSTNLFHVLGISPALGSGVTSTPEGFANTGDEQTVILSDSVWREYFGARQDVIGRTVKISGKPYTVVGVMPRGFALPLPATSLEIWTPVALQPEDDDRIGQTPFYSVIARLNTTATLSSAQAEIKTLQPQVAAQYTDQYRRDLVTSAGINDYAGSLVKPEVLHTLLVLFAASALLWIIACVNVAGLLLARGTVRQREIAVRGALGASRLRIVQQLLLEGLMLSFGGSLLGLGLAFGLLNLFAHGLSMELNLRHATPGWRSIFVFILILICCENPLGLQKRNLLGFAT